ncbi:MAG: hypothetical protein ACLR4Z_17805 [Butyricicoccaceae bacterium]
MRSRQPVLEEPGEALAFRSTAHKHEKKVLTDEQIELAKAFTATPCRRSRCCWKPVCGAASCSG